jgi:hypothetical protein
MSSSQPPQRLPNNHEQSSYVEMSDLRRTISNSSDYAQQLTPHVVAILRQLLADHSNLGGMGGGGGAPVLDRREALREIHSGDDR